MTLQTEENIPTGELKLSEKRKLTKPFDTLVQKPTVLVSSGWRPTKHKVRNSISPGRSLRHPAAPPGMCGPPKLSVLGQVRITGACCVSATGRPHTEVTPRYGFKDNIQPRCWLLPSLPPVLGPPSGFHGGPYASPVRGAWLPVLTHSLW